MAGVTVGDMNVVALGTCVGASVADGCATGRTCIAQPVSVAMITNTDKPEIHPRLFVVSDVIVIPHLSSTALATHVDVAPVLNINHTI